MGEYSASDVRDVLESTGEVMVVLESDREYELHLHDTEFDENANTITTQGMFNGEYRYVTFPASAVEHHYIHKES